jgi:beta-N-acetylhexosaminidase
MPRAAALAVAAGTDLLCLGRDSLQDEYLAVRSALVDAVRDGTIAGERLEEAADRVARLRGGLARARSLRASGALGFPVSGGLGEVPAAAAVLDGAGAAGAVPGGVGLTGTAAAVPGGVGLTAARRAVRMSGPRPVLRDPLIVEVEPRENIAAGRFGWGLGPWAPAGSVRRVNAAAQGPRGPAAQGPAARGPATQGPELLDAAGILGAAAGRSLVAVVRDAHRDANTRSLVSALLAARPDTVLVEMGLPLWPPPAGTSYLATYGASRASAQAAAELLGLA